MTKMFVDLIKQFSKYDTLSMSIVINDVINDITGR